jgi:hypothetical protein
MDLPADPVHRVRQSLHRFAIDALASRAEPNSLAVDVEGLCGQYPQLDSTIRDFYSAAQVFLRAISVIVSPGSQNGTALQDNGPEESSARRDNELLSVNGQTRSEPAIEAAPHIPLDGQASQESSTDVNDDRGTAIGNRDDAERNDGLLIGISSLDQLKENLEFLEKGPLPVDIVQAAEHCWHIIKANCPNYWHEELYYS